MSIISSPTYWTACVTVGISWWLILRVLIWQFPAHAGSLKSERNKLLRSTLLGRLWMRPYLGLLLKIPCLLSALAFVALTR